MQAILPYFLQSNHDLTVSTKKAKGSIGFPCRLTRGRAGILSPQRWERRQVEGLRSTSTGKISKRPTSIQKESTTLLREEKAP